MTTAYNPESMVNLKAAPETVDRTTRVTYRGFCAPQGVPTKPTGLTKPTRRDRAGGSRAHRISYTPKPCTILVADTIPNLFPAAC